MCVGTMLINVLEEQVFIAFCLHTFMINALEKLVLNAFVDVFHKSLLFSTARKSLALTRDGPYRCFAGLHGNRAVQCSCCDAGRESGVFGVPCQ